MELTCLKGFVGPAFAGVSCKAGYFCTWMARSSFSARSGRTKGFQGLEEGPAAVHPHPFVWTSAESPEGAASGPAGLAAGATEAGVEEVGADC